MSKYTHEQEVEIVKDAMMLTAAIKIGEEELSKQKCKKFKTYTNMISKINNKQNLIINLL